MRDSGKLERLWFKRPIIHNTGLSCFGLGGSARNTANRVLDSLSFVAEASKCEQIEFR